LAIVLFKGGWTIAWRRFHAGHPIAAEPIKQTVWWLPLVLGALAQEWSWGLLAVVFAAVAARTLWWYGRPNGWGRRLLEANRTNPRRGFEWSRPLL
jgi:hypothetical protein